MTLLKPNVYLADLTHTGQGIALNAFPLGIASVASYALQELGSEVDVRIFKYPQELADSIVQHPPQVVGFSNYMWNLDLSYAMASQIKKYSPDTVVIFGGPNYDSDERECDRFFRRHPNVDFYIFKEGERAFAEILRRLIDLDFSVDAVKGTLPASCHYLHDDQLVRGELIDRIQNLDEIPSPYTTGLMDQFFEGQLMPLIQTNRGCPFTCTFCVEGEGYYNKVSKGPTKRVAEELQYIARRVAGIPDLRIADSNFGMYAQDMDICKEIAKVQKEFDWPRYVHVATGKNHKERVLQGAEILNGALRLAASVQSMDDNVLKNIKRQNISVEEAVDVARKGNAVGSNTYSEIILCLPGDTKEAHFKTIHQMIDARLNFLRLFTLMMLPGTELASSETREQYDMVTRYRVLPRCFGTYNFAEETIHSIEIEEVCVSNSTMPYEDYLDCRIMDLFVEVFYNDGIFEEILGLMKLFDISSFEWLIFLYDHRDQFPAELRELLQGFRRETDQELWQSKVDLEAFVKNEETINRYVSGELGSNLIFKYKALMVLRHGGLVNELAADLTKTMLDSMGLLNTEPWLEAYLEDLRVFSSARKGSTLDSGIRETHVFTFDLKLIEEKNFLVRPQDYSTPDGTVLKFFHTDEQADYIQKYLDVYGDSVIGLSRILANIYVKKMHRSFDYVGSETTDFTPSDQSLNKLEIGPFG